MNVSKIPASRRLLLILAGCGALAATTPALGGTTSTTGSPGSLGSTYFLNANPSGGALQGENASKPNTSILLPYGVLGEYDPSPQPTGTYGVGIAGVATEGYGVGGEAFGSEPTMYALSMGNGDGIITVTNGCGYGQIVYATANVGIFSESANNDGVVGFTDNGNGKSAGVYGGNNSQGGAGIAAFDLSGYGIFSNGKIGLMTLGSETGIAAELSEYSSAVGEAVDAYTSSSNGGEALLGLSTGEGVIAMSSSATALVAESLKPGIDLIRGQENTSDGSATSFLVQGASANRSGEVGTNTASSDVQIQGDVYLTGNVYENCDAYPVTSSTTCAGSASVAVPPMPQNDFVEDAGEAQLIDGRAHVALARSFAPKISAVQPYMVFITPNGESRGLYVIAKSPVGFDVRENGAGRSTMTFDYRILARPSLKPQMLALRHRTLNNVAVRYVGKHPDIRNAFPMPANPRARLAKLHSIVR